MLNNLEAYVRMHLNLGHLMVRTGYLHLALSAYEAARSWHFKDVDNPDDFNDAKIDFIIESLDCINPGFKSDVEGVKGQPKVTDNDITMLKEIIEYRWGRDILKVLERSQDDDTGTEQEPKQGSEK